MVDKFKRCADWFKENFPDVKINEDANITIDEYIQKPTNPQAPFEVDKLPTNECIFCGLEDCDATDEYECKTNYLLRVKGTELEGLFDEEDYQENY
jgi:hypothetical protein